MRPICYIEINMEYDLVKQMDLLDIFDFASGIIAGKAITDLFEQTQLKSAGSVVDCAIYGSIYREYNNIQHGTLDIFGKIKLRCKFCLTCPVLFVT